MIGRLFKYITILVYMSLITSCGEISSNSSRLNTGGNVIGNWKSLAGSDDVGTDNNTWVNSSERFIDWYVDSNPQNCDGGCFFVYHSNSSIRNRPNWEEKQADKTNSTSYSGVAFTRNGPDSFNNPNLSFHSGNQPYSLDELKLISIGSKKYTLMVDIVVNVRANTSSPNKGMLEMDFGCRANPSFTSIGADGLQQPYIKKVNSFNGTNIPHNTWITKKLSAVVHEVDFSKCSSYFWLNYNIEAEGIQVLRAAVNILDYGN